MLYKRMWNKQPGTDILFRFSRVLGAALFLPLVLTVVAVPRFASRVVLHLQYSPNLK